MVSVGKEASSPVQSSKPASGMAQVSSRLGTPGSAFPAYSCRGDPRTNGVGTAPACWEHQELGLWVAVTLEDRLRQEALQDEERPERVSVDGKTSLIL